jgi:UDP-3-O-[3-hydroxymyristoyl] glucosamine N-acyltransferase
MRYEILKTGENKGRIKALKSFADVEEGDIGGFVESYDNMSQSGTSWVYDDARVHEKAKISGNCVITDKAVVKGEARVKGYSRIEDTVILSGKVNVIKSACIYGKVELSGNETVRDDIGFKKWPTYQEKVRKVLIARVARMEKEKKAKK